MQEIWKLQKLQSSMGYQLKLTATKQYWIVASVLSIAFILISPFLIAYSEKYLLNPTLFEGNSRYITYILIAFQFPGNIQWLGKEYTLSN